MFRAFPDVLPAVLLATIASSPLARAAISDVTGVYALIEKVEFLPDRANAKRVRIYGAFAIARGQYGSYYLPPRWGFLEYRFADGKLAECRKQWNDLASVAGKQEIVGFGSRREQQGVRIHEVGTHKRTVAVYHPKLGVRRLGNAAYGPSMALRCLPKPIAPTRTDYVPCKTGKRPGQPIKLVARNCVETDVRYLFEIERPDGSIVASPAIAPGKDGETSWETRVAFEPMETVVWRVRVLREGVRQLPVASARFVPSKPREDEPGGRRKDRK